MVSDSPFVLYIIMYLAQRVSIVSILLLLLFMLLLRTELGKFIYLLPSGSLKVKCPVNTQISLDLPHYHIITWPQLFAQLFCFLKTVGNCYHDLSDSQC